LKAVALDELKALLCAFLPVNISLFTSTSSKPQKRLSDSPAVFGSLEERVACLAPAKRWEVPMIHELAVVVHQAFRARLATHGRTSDEARQLKLASVVFVNKLRQEVWKKMAGTIMHKWKKRAMLQD
jgi:hypothetical protein